METTLKETHLGAYAAIIQSGKIALVRKARGAYIGLLDLPGGTIEFGESPVEAVEREVLEETGLIVTSSLLVRAESANYPYNKSGSECILHHLGFIYQCGVKSSVIKHSGDELDAAYADWYDMLNLDMSELTPFASLAVQNTGY